MVTNTLKQAHLSPREDERRNLLARWVAEVLSADDSSQEASPLKTIGGDASSRRYYRVQEPEGSLIAVDAPPEKEDNKLFIDIAHEWREKGIHVPEVHAFDLDKGFMLLEDFGDQQLHNSLSGGQVDGLYQQAIAVLKKIQILPASNLPVYDAQLLKSELSYYPQWFLKSFLDLTLSNSEEQAIEDLFSLLINSALEQPKVTIHRDYHSRNLMVCENADIGVLDFQGAMHGPLLYDIVSLLKDCYHCWPTEKVEQWLLNYTCDIPQLASVNMPTIQQWFDWMGVQRHLKCLGIFSRLWRQDSRPNYLSDLPETLNYVINACKLYPQLENHALWLEKRVVPELLGRVEHVREEVGA